MPTLFQALPAVLPVLAFGLLACLFQRRDRDGREALLLAAVATALFLAGVTEALSLFHALTRGALLASWGGLVAALAAGLLWRRPERGPAATFRGWTLALLLPLQLILLTVAVIAVMAPPNNWDSMAYHMARVMHWIQNQGIGHYPTHCTRQVFMPPLAEWMILHLQLLSGGDHLANLVQWSALAGSVLGVSWIAKGLGAKAWGQAFAAVAAGTIPLALLQASSTQNDLVCACWLVCGAAFGLDALRRADSAPGAARGRWRAVGAAGAAFGLALLTKGTAYLYALPFLLWFGTALVGRHAGLAWPPWRREFWRGLAACRWRPAGLAALLFALPVFLPSAGHYARNQAVSGHLLGPGLEVTEWRVEPAYYANRRHGFDVLGSNLLRNASLQFTLPDGERLLGQAGADAWLAGGARRLGLVRPPETRNQWLQDAVTRCHQRLGWDVNDPATSWNARPYHLSLGWNHEDTAASPLHTLLALLALPLLAWPRWPEKVRAWGYVAAVAAGVALFAGALGWQEWHVRLMLPSLILAMPAAGLALEKALTPWGGIPVAALLLLAAVPYVVNNATRPLFGYDPEAEPPEPERILTARSIFRQPREAQYFSCRPDAYDSFVRVAESLADSRCARLGLQMGWNSWEYPLWVLTAARGGHPRIEHVGVTNETARLAERPPFRGFVPERRLYLYSLPGFRPQTPPRPRPD